MNDETSRPTREDWEVRVTALVLGELPPEEVLRVETAIAQDPALQAWKLRLEESLGLVRDAVGQPASPASEVPVGLRMSEARREMLLAQLRRGTHPAAGDPRAPKAAGGTNSSGPAGPLQPQPIPFPRRISYAFLAAAAALVMALGWMTWQLEDDSTEVTTLAGRDLESEVRLRRSFAAQAPALPQSLARFEKSLAPIASEPSARDADRAGTTVRLRDAGPLMDRLAEKPAKTPEDFGLSISNSRPPRPGRLAGRAALDLLESASVPAASAGVAGGLGSAGTPSANAPAPADAPVPESILAFDVGAVPVPRLQELEDLPRLKSVERGRGTRGGAPVMLGVEFKAKADAAGDVAQRDGALRPLSEQIQNWYFQAAESRRELEEGRADKGVLRRVRPEIATAADAVSTFSLNVGDTSFRVAEARLAQGTSVDPGTVRADEFLNAFDYRDPLPRPGAPLGFTWERAAHPVAQGRDLLRLALRTAASGRSPGRPFNVVIVLDASGSMERPDRVATVRAALAELAKVLGAGDRVSVVAFARGARVWVDGWPGERAGELSARVGDLVPEGGTNLEEAIRVGYETARRHFLSPGENHVVLLTDGVANLGEIDAGRLRAQVETERRRGIALDCFGVGLDGLDDARLEELSRHGDGRYAVLDSPEDAARDFASKLAGALEVAAADVKVQVEFNPARVKSWRQVGHEHHQLTREQFRDDAVDAAELAAAEAGQALYVIEAIPAGHGPLGIVRARFRLPGTRQYEEREWVIPYDGAAPAVERSAPSMRLAAVAGIFAELLAGSPYAAGAETAQLRRLLDGVPAQFAPATAPARLEAMLQQAKSVGYP